MMMQTASYIKYQNQIARTWLWVGILGLFGSAILGCFSFSAALSFLCGSALVLVPTVAAHFVWLRASFAPKKFIVQFVVGFCIKLITFIALCSTFLLWDSVQPFVMLSSMVATTLATWLIQAIPRSRM